MEQGSRAVADVWTWERRKCTRFNLVLEMSYSVVYGTGQEKGTGQTIDVSSSGFRFMAADPLPVGVGLLVAIAWPARLDGLIALQLVVDGTVVRSSGRETAVKLERHKFKTRERVNMLV